MVSFVVNFYEFNKTRNATGIPPQGYLVKSYNCTLKGPTSIMAPVIVIDEGVMTNPMDIGSEHKELNYCFIEEFKRFYFVEDWTFNGTQLIATLSCDTLGTFWNQLKNKQYWIARASGKRPDGEDRWKVSDAGMKLTGGTSHYMQQVSNPFLFQWSNGGYLIGIINKDTNQIGATSFYYFTMTGFKNLCSKVFNIDDYSLSSEIIDNATYTALYNPMQYVSSAMYIPYPVDRSTLTHVSSISFGWYSFNLPTISAEQKTGCYYINADAAFSYFERRFPIQMHPDINGDKKKRYLMFEPYTTMTCVMEPFGTFSIDTTRIDGYTNLIARVRYDWISGYAYLTLNFGYAADDTEHQDSPETHLINTQCKVSVDVELAQIGRNNYAYQSAMASAQLGNLNAQYQLSQSDLIIGAISAYQQGVTAGNSKQIPYQNTNIFGQQVSPYPYYRSDKYKEISSQSSVNGINNVINGVTGVLSAASEIASSIASGDASRVQSTVRSLVPTYDARVYAAKAAGALTVAEAKTPVMQRFGSNAGTIVFNQLPWYIEYRFYNAQQLDPDSYGFAYNEYHVLSDFDPAGYEGKTFIYVQCEGARIHPGGIRGAFNTEREQLEAFLNTGFYVQ